MSDPEPTTVLIVPAAMPASTMITPSPNVTACNLRDASRGEPHGSNETDNTCSPLIHPGEGSRLPGLVRQAPMRRRARFLTTFLMLAALIAASFAVAGAPAGAAVPGQVVITEWMYNPLNSTQEFI